MPRSPSTAQLLSHLPRCPQCGYYIGAPLLCKGKNGPTHKDFWFEKVRLDVESVPQHTPDNYARSS